jgi:hypothetical protein
VSATIPMTSFDEGMTQKIYDISYNLVIQDNDEDQYFIQIQLPFPYELGGDGTGPASDTTYYDSAVDSFASALNTLVSAGDTGWSVVQVQKTGFGANTRNQVNNGNLD